MPAHIRLILKHAALGGVIALVFVAALLWLNVGNLWHLVTHTDGGFLALVVLTAFCWITFGSVQIGIRIMTMGADHPGGGTRVRQPIRMPQPVRVATDHEARRQRMVAGTTQP